MDLTVKCLKCECILEEPTNLTEAERKPCLACGSLSRIILMGYDDSIVPYESINIKARHGERCKIRPFLVETIRDELQVTGKWAGKKVNRQIIIDHENDLYKEKVVDIDTGEIIYEFSEPRSNHTGHGYAKLK